MQFYIGLVFDSHSVHFQKIESFKKRYDTKFYSNPYIHLTLLPPFEKDFKNIEAYKKFVSNLNDIIESHLMGITEALQVEFNGINMWMGRKGILSLTPKLSLDYDHLRESLFEFLKEEGVKFKNTKELNRIFMPIGRFEHSMELEASIEQAKMEFSSPFVLNTKCFTLFERSQFIWNQKENLYTFTKYQHRDLVNQLWAN